VRNSSRKYLTDSIGKGVLQNAVNVLYYVLVRD